MTFITVFGSPFIVWLVAGLVLTLLGFIAAEVMFGATVPQRNGQSSDTHSFDKSNNNGATDDDV